MLVSCVVALTASHGGFRNVTIDNIEVYDTFRSAIAIETVDGGSSASGIGRARNPVTCATFTSAK